jgi:Fe2+ transport system protein B
LTGVRHKVVIVSTLETIYLEAEYLPATAQDFDLVENLKRAVLTIPQNLKALLGLDQARTQIAHSGLTPAFTRETNRRWTGLMVFWTISLGYGMAVLFYQIGTFVLHSYASAIWIASIVAYSCCWA